MALLFCTVDTAVFRWKGEKPTSSLTNAEIERKKEDLFQNIGYLKSVFYFRGFIRAYCTINRYFFTCDYVSNLHKIRCIKMF